MRHSLKLAVGTDFAFGSKNKADEFGQSLVKDGYEVKYWVNDFNSYMVTIVADKLKK